MTAPDEVVRRLYERFMNNGDRSVAEELIDEGFVDHSNPAVGAAGRSELIELVLSARTDDPALASTIVASRSGADLAMVQIESTIAGKAWQELHVFRVADERIIERWGLRVPRTEASDTSNDQASRRPR